MRSSRSTALPLLLAIGLATAPAMGQESVTVTRSDGQAAPLTAYAVQGAGCRGVVLVSPGAGGSEMGHADLAEGLSALGHLAVVVGHRESGLQALRERTRHAGLQAGLAALITDAAAYRGRFMDLSAARLWAEARCPSGATVLLGHSMGAATVMLEAGARNRLGLAGGDGYAAYIALSPQGPGSIFPEHAWADIRRPVLSITGTRDQQLGAESWEARTLPYADMPPGCKWLAVFDGVSHMNLAGIGLARRTHGQLMQLVGAFLDGVDRGDCAAPAPSLGMRLQAK